MATISASGASWERIVSVDARAFVDVRLSLRRRSVDWTGIPSASPEGREGFLPVVTGNVGHGCSRDRRYAAGGVTSTPRMR